jgi:RHS repeat-associated protein
MQMQLASIPVLSQPPLAAMPQLSEKPHQGFATKKTAWNPGPNVCNFTVTLGLQVVVSENGVRKTYSARYYNPATGRFVERDPLDGYINVPATLHKYLYASGNPVNRIDPSGKGDELIEEAELDERALTQSTRYAAKMLKLEHDALRAAIECLKQANTFAGNPDIWINVINGDVYLATEAGYELLDNLLFY